MLDSAVFVSTISVENGPNSKWIQRVDAVKAHFTDVPFFFVEAVSKGRNALSPAYSQPRRSSSYRLDDESEYQVKIATYDPANGSTGLTAENGGEDVTLAIPAGDRIGAECDSHLYTLQTHSLPRQTVLTYSRLMGVNYTTTPAPDHPDYRIMLNWTVTKKATRAIVFGALSALAALGLGLAKLATDDLSKFKGTYANILLALSAAASIGCAAGLLYVVFNKK